MSPRLNYAVLSTILYLLDSKTNSNQLHQVSSEERINSAANLILEKEKVSLDSSVIDELLALRIGKSFMIFVKKQKQGQH